MLINARLLPFKCLLFIAVLSVFSPFFANAQTLPVIKGLIVRSSTYDRLAEVKVTNLRTQIIKVSDEQGIFTIPANIGDTLEFSKTEYAVMKQVITSTNDIIVSMQRAVTLNTVVVKGYSTKTEQQATMDAYRSKGVYYNGKPPVLSYLASPVNGLYELFGKEPKRARRFNAYIKAENEGIQINKRFTKSLIKQVTGLPDEEIPAFMDAYRPQYEEAAKWSDYELMNYIKKSYAAYEALKKAKAQPAP
ncbi:hypothetical protein GCM10027037_17980 [Mucilaginibacter koreensis]